MASEIPNVFTIYKKGKTNSFKTNNLSKQYSLRKEEDSTKIKAFVKKVQVYPMINSNWPNDETIKTNLRKDHISYWNFLYVFAILGYCIFFTSLLLVIPQHNAIEQSKFWYEVILIFMLGFPFHLVFSTLQVCIIVFKIPSLISFLPVVRLFFSCVLGFVAPYCICYFIWTICLGYNHPLPFIGFSVYPLWIVFMGRLWFEFPETFRKIKKFRRKIQAYMFYLLWLGFMGLQYSGLSSMLAMLPKQIQWTMAIIMPIIRWLNSHVLGKLMKISAGSNNPSAIFAMNTTISCGYSLYVAITLASATEITLYWILGVEFTLNIILCCRVIKMDKNSIGTSKHKNGAAKATQQELIIRLTLNETIEVLVPMAYSLSFLLAYYGPNATILGNVRNSYWNYNAVEDITKLLTTSFEMFSIDLLSAVINGVLLWKFCKINLFYKFCWMMQKYWLLIAVTLAGYIYEVMS